MDLVVTGRHLTVSDRFREHIEEKLERVRTIAPRIQRIDVLISHEPNRRQAKSCERVEITCKAKGPVIRAEACMDDKYASLDVALDKLVERLRRVNDRRRVHRGRRTPESVAEATARLASAPAPEPVPEPEATQGPTAAFADSPIEVREKVHASAPMSLEQALHTMEMVGHDFFLFHDIDTDKPSVVYRRRGWSYGVIHLDRLSDVAGAEAAEAS